jgi:ABC-type transport system involved in cytochrome bd biosynthesis fused ATPase/permease subunit
MYRLIGSYNFQGACALGTILIAVCAIVFIAVNWRREVTMADNGLSCSLKASYQDFNLDVSFSVKSGELACIIGPSGCGKSPPCS